jgi:CxxC motif-containing protein (DUF1111 family)
MMGRNQSSTGGPNNNTTGGINPDTGNGASTGTAGNDQVVGGGTAGSGMVMNPGTAGTESVISMTGTAGSGPPPNLDNCTGALPGSYNTLCSGCHNQAGVANSRYPDLYKFMGTEAQFLTQVRTGGMPLTAGGPQMAAYPDTLISDADVMKVYAYFTGQGGNRPSLDSVSLGGVVPLFTMADAKNGPIVFTRDDGAIITRGAGRVRGRHEKEGSFGQFLENYFDNRTYGFVNEDYTNTGTKHITTTYEPVSMPDHNGNRITNWRHWKMQGDNATFMQNDYMKDGTDANLPKGVPPTGSYAFVQYFDDMNPPGARGFTDQNFEFEFGIFISPAALVTPGSRDSYYTDTFRLQIGKGGLTPNNMDFDNGGFPFNAIGPIADARFGGNTTASWMRVEPYNYYGEMALNIQQENVQNFVGGRRLFHTDFTNGQHSDPGNPALTAVAGFAGPMNNTNSCESCHFRNGPGFQLTGALDSKASMVFKFPGAAGQIHQQTGSVTVGTPTTMTVGGTTLTKPNYTVTTMAGGAQPYSARIARKLVGMGLLEAIDERTLLERADPADCNGDGISGRPNYIHEPVTNNLRVGRFGWKAEKVSVIHQVADALMNDIDVGTSILKDSTGKVELQDADLLKMATYMRLLSVPPQMNAGDPDVVAGEQLFKTVGCANCHMSDTITGANHPFTELRNQSIKPYSDLLLHDMGPDLADNSGVAASNDPSAPAAASEWRTAPLWGLGLLTTTDPSRCGAGMTQAATTAGTQPCLNSAATNLGLLHDGRAKTLTEAILWHGGEASKVKAAFSALPAAQQAQLLKFLSNI